MKSRLFNFFYHLGAVIIAIFFAFLIYASFPVHASSAINAAKKCPAQPQKNDAITDHLNNHYPNRWSSFDVKIDRGKKVNIEVLMSKGTKDKLIWVELERYGTGFATLWNCK